MVEKGFDWHSGQLARRAEEKRGASLFDVERNGVDGHGVVFEIWKETKRDKQSVSGARTLRAGTQSVQALAGRARSNTVGEGRNSLRRYSGYTAITVPAVTGNIANGGRGNSALQLSIHQYEWICFAQAPERVLTQGVGTRWC